MWNRVSNILFDTWNDILVCLVSLSYLKVTLSHNKWIMFKRIKTDFKLKNYIWRVWGWNDPRTIIRNVHLLEQQGYLFRREGISIIMIIKIFDHVWWSGSFPRACFQHRIQFLLNTSIWKLLELLCILPKGAQAGGDFFLDHSKIR